MNVGWLLKNQLHLPMALLVFFIFPRLKAFGFVAPK